jgi:DNA-binding MarR family transcriptional regulator
MSLPMPRLRRSDALDKLLGDSPYDPLDCVCRNLKRASRVVEAYYDDAFREAGLTANQFTVLMTLARTGGLTVSELARWVSMDPSTVPRIVAARARARLISVRAGKDRRVRHLRATVKGRRRLAAAFPAWLVAQRRLVEALGPARLRSLRGELGSVRGLLDGAREGSA